MKIRLNLRNSRNNKYMFAVIKTGGKQYIAREGKTLQIEKIFGEEGQKVELDQVLLVENKDQTKIGTPLVAGAKVEVEIIKQFKDKKVEIVKFKNKTGTKKKVGHRQQQTKIKILKIIG